MSYDLQLEPLFPWHAGDREEPRRDTYVGAIKLSQLAWRRNRSRHTPDDGGQDCFL